MNPDDLREEIAVELEALDVTVRELLALRQDVANSTPTTREKTANCITLFCRENSLLSADVGALAPGARL